MRALEPAGTCHRLEAFAPAYILDLSPNGLGAMRVLARQGVRVLGFDCNPSREGFRSCLGRKEVCPDPVREPAALLGYLRERARGEPARPFLLPGNDKFVRFLAEHQAELSREFAFVAPPGNLLLACLSKDKTYALAEQAGVPVPRCAAVAPGGGPELVPDDFPYPAVIKPSFSYDLWGLTRGKVLIARCPEEAVQVLGRLPPEAGFVIQEAIPGEETRLVFYSTYRDGAGRVRAEFLSRKVRQFPPAFGTGSLFESYWDEETLAEGRRLFDALDYRGLATAEFKRDPRDGRLKLIEINPRLWLFHPLSVPAGVDFVTTAYRDATGQEVGQMEQDRRTVRWLHILHDLAVCLHHIRAGRLTVREWRASLTGVHSTSVWDARDPGPFIYGLWLYGRKAFQRLARRWADEVPELTWEEQMKLIEREC